MNTLTPEPVSNETRIRQIADELREMLKTDNDAPRLISEELSGVTYIVSKFPRYTGQPSSPKNESFKLGWVPNHD